MTVSRVAIPLTALLAGVLGCPVLAGDIDVKVIHFGVGDVVRSGGPLAVQLEFRSALDSPVELEAVWELPNADKDITEFSRGFVLNPGQAQRRWIYGVLPPIGEGLIREEVFDLRLYEVRSGDRVRDLGTAKVAASIAETPPKFLAATEDAILVVGPRTYGLDIFTQARANGVIPSMNVTTVIGNLRDAEAFPDRWEGLAPFDAVVWGGGMVPPSRLSEDAANALLEWNERGGNFVIALPAAGDPWSIGTAGRHAFSGMLPATAPTRIEDVRIADILPMLSLIDALRAPDARTRLAVFDPATLTGGWRPFIAAPARKSPQGVPEVPSGSIDASVLGIRREVGFGHMTVLGLDVEEIAARGLQSPAIPEGDVFWNRILGRRADTPSGQEYTALDAAQRLTGGGYSRTIGDGVLVAQEIGLAGEAAVGVLAATAVFTLYWLIAGPLGFAVLKSMKKERWSWVAYVAVAACFTAGIWIVGGSLAGSSARIRHLTVLDMVERAPGEVDPSKPQRRRATGWLSLYAPNYGTTRVALDPSASVDRTGTTGLRNMLASWRSVESALESFPSRERFEMPIDQPDSMDAPSRATSIDFEVRWLGATKDGWGRMPSVVSPIQVSIDRNMSPARISVAGTLKHELPRALEGVTAIHIWPARNPLQSLKFAERGKIADRRFVGQLPNRGVMVSIQSWAPGVELDLAAIFPTASLSDRLGLERALRERYYAPIYASASQLGNNFGIGADSIDLTRSFEMLSFYGMLEPPQYLQNPPSDPDVLRIARANCREIDLSDYFTQPCIILTGWLRDVSLPYMLTVDGDEAPSEGRVFVRWVLPLPSDPSWIVPEKFPRPTAGAPLPKDESSTTAEPASQQDEAIPDGNS